MKKKSSKNKTKKASEFDLLKYKNTNKSLIGKKIRFKTLHSMKKSIVEDEVFMGTLYNSISNKEPIKLCDITGLEGKYECPNTNLRYYDSGVYDYSIDIKMNGIVPYISCRKYGADNDPYNVFLD